MKFRCTIRNGTGIAAPNYCDGPEISAPGIHHVIVNGVPAALDGQRTSEWPGNALRLSAMNGATR